MEPSAFGISRLGKTFFRGLVWILLYFIGFLRLDWQWIIVVLGIWYYLTLFWKNKSQKSTSEQDEIKIFTKDLPTWVVSNNNEILTSEHIYKIPVHSKYIPKFK